MRGYYYIYLIKCEANGRGYVGRSEQPAKRINYHFASLRSGRHVNEEMQKDFNLFGRDAFTYKILDSTIPADHELNNPKNSKEHKWQEALKTYDIRYGYNYKDPRFHPRRNHKKAAS